MQCIYKITNLINGKCYIGQTVNSGRRWKDHQRLAFTEGHKEYDKILYQAMRKYGLDNFIFEVIEQVVNHKTLNQREIYWINFYNSYHCGYNESRGGDGGSEKGHCQGESNGRSKLTLEDVKQIRTFYAEGKSKKECYNLYKTKISDSGFSRVWQGKTWTHVMPDVFTEKNKKATIKSGRGNSARLQRIYSDDEIRIIRQAQRDGVKLNVAFQQFGKTNINTFKDIWYRKTYKEID